MRGDRDALRTLLSNLVDNALRYTPRKGRVDVAVGPQGDHVALVVRDNGTGIAPEEQVRVFDRFYRVARDGAEIALGEGLDGKGLGVSVLFPAAAA